MSLAFDSFHLLLSPGCHVTFKQCVTMLQSILKGDKWNSVCQLKCEWHWGENAVKITLLVLFPMVVLNDFEFVTASCYAWTAFLIRLLHQNKMSGWKIKLQLSLPLQSTSNWEDTVIFCTLLKFGLHVTLMVSPPWPWPLSFCNA